MKQTIRYTFTAELEFHEMTDGTPLFFIATWKDPHGREVCLVRSGGDIVQAIKDANKGLLDSLREWRQVQDEE